MKYLYRILAEVLHVIHGGILIMGFMMWAWWDRFLLLYSIIFFFGMPSWLFTQRCFLTDIENYYRKKSGQDLREMEKSFLGYWGKKLLGRHGPSNRTITWIVGIFYIVITPIWVYSLYLEYLLHTIIKN